MAGNVSARAVRTPANSLRSDLDTLRAGKANLRIDAKNVEILEQIRIGGPLVREVISDLRMSQKEFAINARQAESVISEALSGQRAVQLDWVLAQGADFCRRFGDKLGRHPEVDREQREILRHIENLTSALQWLQTEYARRQSA